MGNSRETDWRPTLNTAVSLSLFCPLRHRGWKEKGKESKNIHSCTQKREEIRAALWFFLSENIRVSRCLRKHWFITLARKSLIKRTRWRLHDSNYSTTRKSMYIWVCVCVCIELMHVYSYLGVPMQSVCPHVSVFLIYCVWWGPSEEEDNYMPFAVMSACLLILMHMLPEGSEAL